MNSKQLRVFIRFAELPPGTALHEAQLTKSDRREAEKLVTAGLLLKGRSVDPDKEPGYVYFFDRLMLSRKRVAKIERSIKQKQLAYTQTEIT